jgi:endonuclease/exonuclease/phosphatase (EEP) superfamily protein YafD
LPYSVGCEEGKPCDIALHSALPIENARVQRLPPFARDRLVSAEVTLNGEKITVVGVHLSKPYFDGASWVELNAIGQFLKTIEGPVVMAGDFNSAPWSDPLATIAAKGMAIGGWPAATWPVGLGPFGVPIDNVFTRGNARIKTLEAGEPLGSNHLPLRATISLYAAP